ncbi:50S ribosomal protein L17 [Rhizoctonia solani AG-1 IB]|uniref:50S ribosomal protein L17 n=1 Tax=Thanatephorus cucumeris (strain AG1-IB / isolate 7/3/14) TaxID=1108050 RepID=M5C5W0_THACB|nr:50S ribosomal protein L17 [Rhizoctonia solani AG-1 IB]
MLRNLVSSLLQHEQIVTTVAKAKETARLADKVITLAKKGTLPARQDAEGFLLNPHSILDKLFTTYRDRYLQRPGGYTRILKYGHRPGDHAPKAILQLVDGPRDLRIQMAGRAVGKETASSFAVNEPGRGLRERTKWAVDKALKFSREEGKKRLEAVAQEHANKLLAEPRAFSGLFNRSVPASETGKRKIRAGERLTGMSTSATGLGLAKGALGKKSPAKIPGFWQRGWQQKVGLPTPPA